MKLSAVFLIILGILVVLSAFKVVMIGLAQFFEVFFGVIFILWNISAWRERRRWPTIGMLLVGTLMVLDAFKIAGVELSAGQIFLIFIGACILDGGLAKLRGHRRVRGKEMNKLRYQEDSKVESLDLRVSGTLMKLKLDSDDKHLYDLKVDYSSTHFEPSHSFTVEDGRGVLLLSNTMRTRRTTHIVSAKWHLRVNSGVPMNVHMDVDISSLHLNMRDLKAEDIIIKGDLSKIVLIPSELVDSTILIEADVSIIKLLIPKNVGIMLKYHGDLSWRTFYDLEYKDGVYVSQNYSTAFATAEIYIRSDLARITFQWI